MWAKCHSTATAQTQSSKISAEVAKSFSDIQNKVRQLDRLVAEIASASQEQSQGISQVNTAVTQMDQVTQANAASAEESASASEELNAQAGSLKAAVANLMQVVGFSAGNEAAKTAGHAAALTACADHTKPIAARRGRPTAPAAVRGNGQYRQDDALDTHQHDGGKTLLAAAIPANRSSEIPLEGDFKNF